MNTISKDFHFCAAHKLLELPPTHPCSRLHGHNYILTIYLKGEPDDRGFVTDYRDLEPIKKYVDDVLDHRYLNEVFDFNTTVENMSKYIYHLFKIDFPNIFAVEMSETEKTKCRYEG